MVLARAMQSKVVPACNTAETTASLHFLNHHFLETAMQWTTPAFTDMRFGFEITMYIANR
jgi:coenzyme PQQ precursor peptide PqqA